MLHNSQLEFIEAIFSDNPFETISPSEHRSIYKNNIHASLNQSLHSIYPLLIKLIGKNYFKMVVKDYINNYPSRSSNLNDYGEYFSDFIAQYQPLKNLTYLSEVAKFEWLYHCLYFAAYHEGLDVNILKEIPPENYNQLRFNLHPASQLVEFYFPILRIIELCKNDMNENITLDEDGVKLLMLRPHYDIVLYSLAPADFIFLQQLNEGETIETALKQAEKIDINFDLTTKLAAWIQTKIIVEVNK